METETIVKADCLFLEKDKSYPAPSQSELCQYFLQKKKKDNGRRRVGVGVSGFGLVLPNFACALKKRYR